jgi:hypothetical protein
MKINWNEWFTYDETSPTCLRWKVNKDGVRGRSGKKIGDVAGSISALNYWRVCLQSKSYLVHRVVWTMKNGDIPEGMQIDHINRVRNDCCISNLRLVSNSVNSRNCKKSSANTSGFTGVNLTTINGWLYWSATWSSMLKQKKAYYKVDDLGYEIAFKMACERRIKEIAKLNEQGAGYSDTHGIECSTGKKACTEATKHNVPVATN